jgi:hypothetical protein
MLYVYCKDGSSSRFASLVRRRVEEDSRCERYVFGEVCRAL